MFYTRSALFTAGRLLIATRPLNSGIQNRIPNRNFCKMAEAIVTYEDVVSYKDKPEIFLVDVRDPKELEDTGVIPASINIPLGQLNDVLKNMSPSEFKTKFGRDFPEKDAELVFSCKLGGRASKAKDTAVELGFVNSKFYKGSWTEWASKQ